MPTTRCNKLRSTCVSELQDARNESPMDTTFSRPDRSTRVTFDPCKKPSAMEAIEESGLAKLMFKIPVGIHAFLKTRHPSSSAKVGVSKRRIRSGPKLPFSMSSPTFSLVEASVSRSFPIHRNSDTVSCESADTPFGNKRDDGGI
eukprot:TRINITY_DN5433_c0_g1_i3.p2 TRINITY_DN5433_c0_g1~~TRINITY_DN5433_c0_g1_i3.p2  ORF type:complete len:145 (-),score=21.05 TRINITY_DN5433_c0_g1_i3:18-452(-)